MAQNTEHYNLVKPDYTDPADVSQLNDNMDTIDGILWQLANAGADEELLKKVQEILDKIGETDDTDGSDTLGSVFAKLNELLKGNTEIINYMPYLNSTVTSENPVSLDILLTQLLYGTTFEYSRPGTYQLLIPANVHKIKVTACGAGGGGAGSPTKYARCGGGGGGDAVVDKEYTVTPQTMLTIIVGKGGLGGTFTGSTQPTNGKDGEATVIGELVTLAGGKGGISVLSTDTSTDTGGKAGGTGGGKGGNGALANNKATDGENGIVGKGGKGSTSTYSSASSGAGGGGSLGDGGIGGYYESRLGGPDATPGTKGAGGGGAAAKDGNMGDNGGNGGDGYAKITLILDAA